MMYQIKSNSINAITDNPHWIKRGNNSYFKHCEKDEAEGIVVKGVIYSLNNNQLEEAIETATITEVDSGELILNTQATSSIMFTTMAEKGDIDDVTAMEHIDQFETWKPSVSYKVGALRVYEGKLYRCVQAHTSQIDWTPGAAASLWTMAPREYRRLPDLSAPFPAWRNSSAFPMALITPAQNPELLSISTVSICNTGV